MIKLKNYCENVPCVLLIDESEQFHSLKIQQNNELINIKQKLSQGYETFIKWNQ